MLSIVDITSPDISNGNGIRVTAWVAGCTHHCKGCHNPWTWKYNQGRSFKSYRREIFEELSEWLDKDYIEGLTLSGGDPLCQDEEGLNELITIIDWFYARYPNKTIWLYTGYTLEELNEMNNDSINYIIDKVDAIIDGPYKEELRDIVNYPFRGSSNQRMTFNKNGIMYNKYIQEYKTKNEES